MSRRPRSSSFILNGAVRGADRALRTQRRLNEGLQPLVIPATRGELHGDSLVSGNPVNGHSQREV